MKFLKILVSIIVIIAAIYVLVGLALPKTYFISRSAEIQAADSVVFNNVADLNQFVKWEPWSKMDTTAKVEIKGTPAQPGHCYTWHGKKTGEGQMEIIHLEPNKQVDFKLAFIQPWQSVADTKFIFEPINQGTKVTWTMSGENKSFLERWMMLCMKGSMEKQFDEGLADLKKLCEG
ncbi:SRPBCC family protein [Pedobacter sp. BS3]|uniref:SRPBCC family protein n=1 Tax=Pedobacter sp. BS3 TaxID=2567937 RepID=UPI0011ED0A27|nr:SRPBCC family protein [Pedobacter sp. BS3]TZF80816.1 SRPBCC family protein [Pedobacter sp. BS3]